MPFATCICARKYSFCQQAVRLAGHGTATNSAAARVARRSSRDLKRANDAPMSHQ